MKSVFNISRVLVFAVTILIIIVGSSSLSQAIESLEVNHLNEVTHLEIPDVTPADYVIKKTEDKIELTVEGLSSSVHQKLKNYSDRFIRKIEINKSSSLSKDIIVFYLSDKNLELFDYLTDSPATLSMDLFVKDDAEDIDAEFEMTQKLKKKAANKKTDLADTIQKLKETTRGPASAEFIKSIGHVTITGDTAEVKKQAEVEEAKAKKKKEVNKDLLRIMRLAKQDLDDILRFDTEKINFTKDSLIEGRNRIYLKFPVLLTQQNYIGEILQKNIKYDFKNSKDSTTQDFLKIRKLYTVGDHKNFLKAQKIFNKKNPNSKFEEMVHHMEAETYLALYKEEGEKSFFDKSLKIYDALLAKYPQSPVAERTLLLVAYLRLNDKSYFEAARNLKTYINNYPKSPLRENIELTLAQSLVRLHEYKDARAIYYNLFKSKSPEIKAHAYFEYGDVFFEEKDYEGAIKAYENALKTFPAEDKLHENVYFNLGETHFLLGNYKDSLNYLRKFITQHPQHDFASYAWTRMGEIFEMSEVGDKIWKGYFNEGHFRFQNKLGGAIAKINLLYHQALSSPDKKFSYIIDQIKAYESLIPLPQSNEYISFKISDVYYEKGDYEGAVKILIDYFKTGDVPHHADKFHRRIGRGLAADLRKNVAQNKITAGFKIFDDTDPLWFKKSERFDFSFYKAELFRLANLCSKATPDYDKYLKDYAEIKNKEELDRSQRLPYLSEVHLRKAQCLHSLAQYGNANEAVAKIESNSLSADLLDDYHFLKAQLLVKAEKADEALQNLNLIAKPSLDAVFLQVELLANSQKVDSAIQWIDKYIEQNSIPEKDRFSALRKKLSLLENHNEKKHAEFLTRFYSEFKDKKFDFDREKFLLYKKLIDQNKTKDAEDVLSRIQAESYWAKLAQETKNNGIWSQKYQKYVDRIPAMQSDKEKK